MAGSRRPLLHYSRKPVERVKSARKQPLGPKPNGLWLSHGNEWARWCRAEDFYLGSLKHRHYVALHRDAEILTIKDARGIDRFTKKYGADLPIVSAAYGAVYGTDGPAIFNILWDEIAEKFQGIMITPYIWKRRLTHRTLWYYPWDVASGCIWDAKAIKRITHVT